MHVDPPFDGSPTSFVHYYEFASAEQADEFATWMGRDFGRTVTLTRLSPEDEQRYYEQRSTVLAEVEADVLQEQSKGSADTQADAPPSEVGRGDPAFLPVARNRGAKGARTRGTSR